MKYKGWKLTISACVVVGLGIYIAPYGTFQHSAGEPSNTVSAAAKQIDKIRLAKNLGKLPLAFEPNRGQTAGVVRYLSREKGHNLFLTDTGAVLTRHASKEKMDVLRMNFAGANTRPSISGSHKLPGKSNYFRGNDPKKWLTDVPQYARVAYKDIYPGIDAVFYGHDGTLEFDLKLNAGARPQDIRLVLSGQKSVHLDKIGNLHLASIDDEIIIRKPVIYQQIKSHRQFVQGGFTLLKSTVEKTEVGFQIARYDTNHPLIIDPSVTWSTYLGGGIFDLGGLSFDGIAGAAVDAQGNVYVTGKTQEPDFPTVSAFQGFLNESWAAFVSKISADGTTLLYSTYLGGTVGNGGNLFGEGHDVAVDASGNAYVTGRTTATDFPVTAGAAQTAFGGGFVLAPPISGTADAFVAKLNTAGNGLVYATYIGGSDEDTANRIELAGNGACVVGSTRSNNLPSGSGGVIQAQNASNKVAGRFKNDVFVAILDGTGATFNFVTYLGGGADDYGIAIALASNGNIAITGQTASSANNTGLNPQPFPTTANGFDTTGKIFGNNDSDAFVSLINPDTGNFFAAPTLVYSTYFGGTGAEFPGGEISKEMGIAVDPQGAIYVAGETSTLFAFDFPVTPGAFQTTQKGGQDAFVAKFDPAKNGAASLVYSTLLGGGSALDPALDLAVDDQGRAMVVGETFSSDFPILNPFIFPVVAPFNTQPSADPATPRIPGQYNGGLFNQGLPNPAPAGGLSDAYVAQLNATGTALLFSSFLGGAGFDMASAIALDKLHGTVVVAGHSHAYDPLGGTATPGVWDFPTTAGVFQPHAAGDPGEAIHSVLKGGTSDAFITKISGFLSVSTVGLSLNSASFRSGNTLTLTATTAASNPPTVADVYVALQLPDGTLLVMQADGSFSTALTPLVANIPVPDFNGVIFNYAFTGVEPTGNYAWFAALTQPGTLNVIGTLATASFTFAP